MAWRGKLIRGKFAHPYLVPFLHLTPEYLPNLKKENKAMYNSFKEWKGLSEEEDSYHVLWVCTGVWEQNGRKPPPPPAIEFNGEATWNWEWMKVVMPADRVPEGWEVFTQAALLYRLRDYEGARSALGEALRINSELALATDELLPGFHSFVPPRAALVPVRTKYLVCYNPQVGLGNVAVVMVSALNLARLTGRVLVVHWNTNLVTRHAWELLDTPGVRLLGDAAPDLGLVEPVKSLYMFHMMDSDMLAGMLELLGRFFHRTRRGPDCDALIESVLHADSTDESTAVAWARGAALRGGPETHADAQPESEEKSLKLCQQAMPPRLGLHLLTGTLPRAPNGASARTAWGSAPIVAVHIRAREAGEDNDDWPTAESPDQDLLVSLTKCIEQAVQNEFGDIKAWDVYLAATTEKARKVASEHLKQSSKKILSLPKLERNRHTGSGAVDSMAEALLLSRADIFVRLVVGTTGFSAAPQCRRWKQ
eukprot:g31050.t1